MRVLRVYPTANDPRQRRRDLALAQLGVETAIVAPYSYGADWSPAPIEPELTHWRSRLLNEKSIPLHLWDPRALERAVREFNPDLVDVHEECYFPAGAQAVRAAGGRPVTMFAAQNISKRYPAPIRWMRRWVLGRLAAAYPCSAEAAVVLREWGYRGHVEVVPYGVEDELFQVRPRGEYVGFVGRLVPEKGVRDLLGFGSRLLCVGSGPLEDEVRSVGARIELAQSLEELAAAFERMAVLAIPSLTTPGWKEQFGRVAVEAMAAGVPVVAYDSGALAEVLGDAGVLVPEGDRAALVAAIEAVVDRPDGVGERGRGLAWQRYRWQAVAKRMVGIYREALASR
ncbi:MAG TPA: glycosyltransferase family 4 protein [Gaiellaceae bacterium]